MEAIMSKYPTNLIDPKNIWRKVGIFFLLMGAFSFQDVWARASSCEDIIPEYFNKFVKCKKNNKQYTFRQIKSIITESGIENMRSVCSSDPICLEASSEDSQSRELQRRDECDKGYANAILLNKNRINRHPDFDGFLPCKLDIKGLEIIAKDPREYRFMIKYPNAHRAFSMPNNCFAFSSVTLSPDNCASKCKGTVCAKKISCHQYKGHPNGATIVVSCPEDESGQCPDNLKCLIDHKNAWANISDPDKYKVHTEESDSMAR